MKQNKILFYFSLFTSILTLIIATILRFCVETRVALYISDVLLNVFAGSIVMIFTASIGYFLERKKILSKLMTHLLKYRNMFSKIHYIKVYDEKRYTETEIDEIKKMISHYINIADESFEETWELYDDLFFLGSNKKKKELYSDVFNYIYQLLNDLRISKYQFEEHNNINYNYEDIKILQEKIFYYEEIEHDKDFTFTNDRLFISNSGMNSNKKWVAINLVEEHLTNMFDEVGKIAYFDKNYNGR